MFFNNDTLVQQIGFQYKSQKKGSILFKSVESISLFQ